MNEKELRNIKIMIIIVIILSIILIFLILSFFKQSDRICNKFGYKSETDSYSDWRNFKYYIECDNKYILKYKCDHVYRGDKWGIMQTEDECFWTDGVKEIK